MLKTAGSDKYHRHDDINTSAVTTNSISVSRSGTRLRHSSD